ncbi:hypothetical protein C1J00_04215 [Streptomyces cahuitamycinicus]|uniref:Uncharacterized protein n=1 Tax=Streptomyces cahuitamycinicus TaxID=2070367 RepID=A0A2N8TWN5_9ACTN|nr:hypothetical protein C1J00_04215 [Streptomyces cahuitamycinicus]
MAPARLRRLNRWLVEGLREDLVVLRRPGFAMVIAETDSLRGCAFGFPVGGDGSWWLGFDGALPRSIEQLAVSGNVFAFADILLRPHPQDREVARRVQERLLTDHQATLGVTLMDRADRQALAALRSLRWLDIGELRRPAGATTFRALVLPLGERTTARLEGLVTTSGGGGPGGA